jgi:hypothetical protein
MTSKNATLFQEIGIPGTLIQNSYFGLDIKSNPLRVCNSPVNSSPGGS